MGERAVAVRALDERDEAAWVVEEIVARRRAEVVALRDIAILYRTNAQSRAFEEALRRRAFRTGSSGRSDSTIAARFAI